LSIIATDPEHRTKGLDQNESTARQNAITDDDPLFCMNFAGNIGRSRENPHVYCPLSAPGRPAFFHVTARIF
jgi:hypothetical protein